MILNEGPVHSIRAHLGEPEPFSPFLLTITRIVQQNRFWRHVGLASSNNGSSVQIRHLFSTELNEMREGGSTWLRRDTQNSGTTRPDTHKHCLVVRDDEMLATGICCSERHVRDIVVGDREFTASNPACHDGGRVHKSHRTKTDPTASSANSQHHDPT